VFTFATGARETPRRPASSSVLTASLDNSNAAECVARYHDELTVASLMKRSTIGRSAVRIATVVGIALSVMMGASQAARACTRTSPVSATEMVHGADAIVRVLAVDYLTPPAVAPANAMRTGATDSKIRFHILEVIRGQGLTGEIVLPGFLSNDDDFNDHASPYQFVRPNSRAGSCYANTYRRDAQFLLVLKKGAGGEYTVNWYALGPVNEQLRSDNDPWLLWVRQEAHRDVPTTSDPTALVHELGTFADALPGGVVGRVSPIEERREVVYRELSVLDAAAVPAPGRGLADPDARVRRGVALYLLVGGTDARGAPRRLDLTAFLEPLVHALRDPDQRVKELAAQAVGGIGPAATAAVPDLVRMLADPAEGLRNTACIGLAGIGPAARDALPALRSALTDSSADVRRFAQVAIDKIDRRTPEHDAGVR